MAGAPGRVPRTDSPGHPAHRYRQLRRPPGDGLGPDLYAATKDEQFRAFDKKTGKLLWQVQLPAAGYASPSTYSLGGKQYVVIACGGGKLNTPSGDKYLAFALD